MKNRTLLLKIALIACISCPSFSQAGLLDYFGIGNSQKQNEPQNKIRIPLGINEKKDQLERLKADLAELQSTEKEFLETIQTNLDQTTAEINETKNKLSEASAKDITFLNKVLSVLNEIYQTLFNLQFVRKELITIIEQHITALENFLKDPDFKALVLKDQSFYTFDDLQKINKKITLQEDKLNHLIEQKNEAVIDLENAKRKISSLTKEYEEKKKKQSEFSGKTKDSIETGYPLSEFDFKELGKILDLEKNLSLFEKQLADLKVQEINQKIAYFDSTIALENDKLKILKTNSAKIKDALRIEPKDLQKAKEKLDITKKESLALRDTFYTTIKELSAQRDTALKELEALKKRNNVSDSAALGISDWNIIPYTINDWTKLCEIGLKDNQISLLENKIDTIRTTIDLEITKFKQKEIDYAILNSWYKITRRQFKSNDEILQDLKHYQGLLTEIHREEAAARDRRNTLANLISIRNKNFTNLKNLIEEFKKQKNSTFKGFANKYVFCLSRLNQTEKIVEEQLENNNQLLKNYTDLITLLNGTAQDINNIINELETKSIWQRSEYAISWNGIKNSGSDLGYFVKDIQKLSSHYFSGLYGTIRSVLNKIIYHPFDLIVFFIKLFFVFFLYRFTRNRLISAITSIRQQKPQSSSLLILVKISEFLLTFIYSYFSSLFIWFTFFILIYFDYISDSFLRVLFYVGSIVLFSYLIYRFIHHLIKFNEKNNFVIFGPFFQKRFVFVFSLFAYLSVILLFFRKAFIEATYHASEFPTILLALYSVLIRTLIIFSIGKDEILSFIPQRGAAWNALSDFINRYYYLLLSIIIMLMLISDPYIGGYGNLVSFILWGTIGTVILIKILLMIQDYIKKKSSTIFFSTDEETVKERFVYAKTWYGLFVVALFIMFVMIGILISLKIWGKSISFKDFSSMLNYGLFSTGYDATSHQHVWFTPLKVLGIVGFIFGGFLLAFTINRFVLHRIFQLLPVDIGIQNTVSSLMRYLIIVAAIFLGFNWGGLGNLLIAIGLVIGSIGYIVKEPIGDFISYFIILVQRPLKIGDLVKINDVRGVVRHITPRSVIIREKNSYTIIMPNTMVINQPVYNWNYSRGFIAFDDIVFAVPYKVDPLQVKNIIVQVLDNNVDILKSPRPIIRLENFGENGYEFLVRGFLSSNKTLDIWDVASDVRYAMVKALLKEEISLAVPTRMVFTQPLNKIPNQNSGSNL
jgi:small-conductance mechanosensitive channel